MCRIWLSCGHGAFALALNSAATLTSGKAGTVATDGPVMPKGLIFVP
jgi:hypothetical protein